MKTFKHPLYSHRNWVFIIAILIVILLLVYPFDLWSGRLILFLLGVNLIYGLRRNWLQHLVVLKWFDDIEIRKVQDGTSSMVKEN